MFRNDMLKCSFNRMTHRNRKRIIEILDQFQKNMKKILRKKISPQQQEASLEKYVFSTQQAYETKTNVII